MSPADLLAFIAGGADDPEHFEHLARGLFARHYALNAPYRAFCDGRGRAPETVASWRDIPAVPAAAFKRFALTAAPEEDCRPERGGRVFHSSGTTGAQTSRHFLDAAALDLYRASLRAGFRRFALPDGASPPILALMPPPEAAPHSSLSFMLGELIGDYGGRFFFAPGWQRELAGVLRRASGPLVLFGTAFAWVHFFDGVDTTFALPPGSRVVETGGFKGRSREVSRDDLYAL
ncbi:MAG: long-chain fatty acid--CoA ligase, partial [Acetobacteraceae bacterium]|nr:long-chain fatty acid--CoA ligase [Acetobacteraceae bacterium]